MKYLQIYLICSVLLYFIGPITWETYYPALTFLMIFVYQYALYAGYKSGIRTPLKNDKQRALSYNWFLKHYILLASIVIVVRLLMTIRTMFLYGFSDLSSLIETAFTEASEIYQGNQLVDSGSAMFGGTLLSLLVGFTGPITIAFIPMTIIVFRELSLSQKIIGLVACTIMCISKSVSGTNEGPNTNHQSVLPNAPSPARSY